MPGFSDVDSLIGTQVVVGLSQIVQVTVDARQNSVSFYKFSGGSLLVGGATLTWSNGYIVMANQIINVSSTGNFYLAAVGSTCVVMMLKGRTAGAE